MRQVSLRFGSEHFQIQTSKLPCAPLSFILPPRSRGWSSAAGDQSQQRKHGSYIKMEDYTSCPASLIKRLEKVLLRKLKKMNLLSFSLFYIPLVLRFINRCEKTWTENVVLDRILRMCDVCGSTEVCLCCRDPTTQISARLLSSATVCACVHLSARLMDLQEMALGIYYHV